MDLFLQEIKQKILRNLGDGYERLLGSGGSSEPTKASADREIMRLVFSAHCFHTAFLNKEESEKLCKDSGYQAVLTEEVTALFRLYRFAGPYFPREPIAGKARYLYYPSAFLLFALCRKSLGLIGKCAGAEGYLFLNIITKSMAVLSLLGTGLLGTAYPMLSEITEQYLKLLLVLRYPEISDTFATHVNWSLILGSGNREEEAAFEKRYGEAVKQYPDLSREAFLQFGYLLAVPDFSACTEKSFDANGILTLLNRDPLPEIQEKLNDIGALLTLCNRYTHGSVLNSRFAFLHYLEMTAVLSETVGDVYGMICDKAETSDEIDGVDVYEILDRTGDEVRDYLNRKTEELLENADEKSDAKRM